MEIHKDQSYLEFIHYAQKYLKTHQGQVIAIKLIQNNFLIDLQESNNRYQQLLKNLIHKELNIPLQSITTSKGIIFIFIQNINKTSMKKISLIIDRTKTKLELKLITVKTYQIICDNEKYEILDKLNNIIFWIVKINSDNENHISISISSALRMLEMAKAITHNIINSSFSMCNEPIVSLSEKTILYHECLLRLPINNIQNTSIQEYILVAEKFNIISTIDEMVIDRALEYISNNRDINVGVNISSKSNLMNNLGPKLISLLNNKQIAERLTIEITETALNQDLHKVKNFIDTMKAFGCKVSLDDFGSGYTSMIQLSECNFDIIKIDGYFIKKMQDNNKYFSLVQGIVDISHKLGYKVVAEHVENKNVVDMLQQIGINYMQGFYFTCSEKYGKKFNL